jgi:hypothetical protein
MLKTIYSCWTHLAKNQQQQQQQQKRENLRG